MYFFNKFLILFSFVFSSIDVAAHGDEGRIEFWKKYYNPTIEVIQEKTPSIKIKLHKIGSFYQLESIIKNFDLTPEEDMRNNNSTRGYVKLFINGDFVTRIYHKRFFMKKMPIGNNEIKAILSSNMDHDLTYKNKLVEDTIYYQFPEYNFAEARAKSYDLFVKCEFSSEGQTRLKELNNQGMTLQESSHYLQCVHDSRSNTLDSFKKQMKKYQLAHYNITQDALLKRIDLWKSYEDNQISLNDARNKNKFIEDSIDVQMNKFIDKIKDNGH